MAKLKPRELKAEYARIFNKINRDPNLTASTKSAVGTGIKVTDIDLGQYIQQPQLAAKERHAKAQKVKAGLFQKYMDGNWRSKRDAAKKLTPYAKELAVAIGASVLRTDNAENTVYRWLLSLK